MHTDICLYWWGVIGERKHLIRRNVMGCITNKMFKTMLQIKSSKGFLTNEAPTDMNK